MRQKILFVINSLTGGGAERVMATLLQHSEPWRDRYDIALALLDEEPIAYPLPGWLEVHRLDCGFSLARSAARLRGLVGRLNPALTLSFLTRANVANAIAMAGRRRPWIVSERVNTSAHLGEGAKAQLGKLMVRATYPHATALIAVSQGVADDLAQNFAVPAKRISVVANPVDLAQIGRMAAAPAPVTIDGPYVFAMGRLVENKNFALLIEAFARSGLPGKLVIGGEGPLRPALEQQIAGLGLDGRVVLAGFLDNPFAVAARAEFFVLPSNAEGFPNGLVEAMALGKAVVSTNCASGPAEILAEMPRHAVHGLMVAPHGLLVPCNDAQSMAEAMRRMNDPATRSHYAARALARAQDFTAEQATRRYWQLIEQSLARP